MIRLHRKWSLMLAFLVSSSCSTIEPTAAEKQVSTLKIYEPNVSKSEVTIVFEAGLGDDASTWSSLVKELKSDYRLVTYSRPGYREFELPATLPGDEDGTRAGMDVARNLKSALDQSQISPPYLIVGHSIGGLYALSFAKIYPDSTAGVVLVDGRLPAFTSNCQKADLNGCTIPSLVLQLLPQNQRAEVKGSPETETFTSDPQGYGSLPMTLLVAKRPPPLASDDFQLIWRSTAQEFTKSLPNARIVETDTTHYIHQKDTELVAREIKALVERIN